MDRYHGMTRKQLAERCAYLEKCFREYDLLISHLDKAMAPQEIIDKHTKEVGGFVSSLNLTESAEQIVNRAIGLIKRLK